MACEIKDVGKEKLFSRLMKLTNNDNLRSLQYITTIMNPDFNMWYVSTTGKEVDLSNMNKISPTFIKAVKKYISLNDFSVTNSTQKYNTARTGIFENDLAKEEHAINTLATFILKGENALRNAGKQVDKNLLKQTLLKQLYTHVQKNKDSLTDDQREYCNILYSAIKNNDDLYNIVIRHPKVNELSRSLGLFRTNENILDNEDSDTEIIDVLDDEGIAGLREDWSDLGDQRKDYSKNISKEVKQLFSLTGETISTEKIEGNPNYNSATYSGIPESIEFSDYYKTIMTNANFDNATDFVNSLYQLADRFPNRSSLSIIADKLNGNDEMSINLRNKVYTQFNQARVERNELLYNSTQINPRIRNRGSFPRLVIYDKVIIAFNNLISVPTDVSKNAILLGDLTNQVKQISNVKEANERNLQYNSVRDKLIDIFNTYNIGITDDGINNYIKYNNNGSVTNNLINLIQIADSFNKVLIDTYPKVVANNEISKQWYRDEYNIAKESEERGENYIIRPIPTDKLNDISKASNRIANLIAETFTPYQTLNLEFNSINVENNLVSDIIKPSMLKRFFDRLNNEDASLEYFRNKAKLSQYQNSNILEEELNSNGSIKHPGILRIVNGEYQLTPYYKFLDYQLFNGARNEILGNNKTYSGMTRTEWDITALNEFINNEDTDQIGKFKLSRYFLQTPSDAPKNFTVTSYRLSVEGLYNDYTNDRVYEGILTSLPDNGVFVFGSNPLGINGNPSKGTGGAALSAYKYFGVLQGEKMDNRLSNSGRAYGLTTVNAPKNYKTKEEIRENILKLYNYARNNPEKDFYIAYTGDANKRNLNGLTNKELAELFKDNNIPSNIIFEKAFNNLVRDSKNNTLINRNHPIYEAYRNIIQQEYNDAAQALTFLFETNEDENGNITIQYESERRLGENSKAILKEEFRVSDLSNTTAELNYHRKGNKILDGDKLVGNVFNINKLNLNDNADSTANVNEIVDSEGNKISQLLYGGRGRQSIRITRNANGTITANLTQSQQEAIDNYLDNYFVERRKQAETYFANYINHIQGFNNVRTEGLTKEEQAAQESSVRQRYNDFVTEFSLNYTIQYNNFNDLFAGNPKFYKNNQDTIKRNKEIQAGGLIYAGYELNNTEEKNLGEIRIGDKVIPITSSFKYISLNDVNRPSSNIDSIKKQLDKANAPQSVKDFILGQFGGNTTISDAQSYITLDEFVRRAILSGEYDNYKETIEALYDENKPIDYNNLSKLIQVQKNFYYGLDIDNNTGLEVPTQIKNAEFVLIPRFLGDSELAKLNQKMLDNGVNQANFISTEKATTNKILTFWNKEGNIDSETEATFDSQLKSSIKTGWYSNLYKQQDVPQHMDDENKAGIQIIKKMLDNIDSTEEGRKLKKQFFDNYNANIESSFNELANRLGVKYSNGEIVYKDGSPVVDVNAFYDLIRDELTSRGADSNILSYATIVDGEPLMPTYINNVRTKLESVVQSIFTNNITRQTIPGFHASQVSNIGYSKKLRYHPNGENYMEIMIPRHMVKLYDKFDADGNKVYDFTIEELQAAGLDYMIGYRIPTEGKQSVVRMKVVGFLDESQGSTIIVPDEFVTQTGSDFDIDSVYSMYHNVWFDKEGKPHKVKFNSDFSDEGTFNRYVHYVNREVDRKTKELYGTLLNQDEYKDLKEKIRKEVEDSNKEYSDYLEKTVADLIKSTDEIWAEMPNNIKTALTPIFKNKTLKFNERVDLIVDILNEVGEDIKSDSFRKFAEIYKKIQETIDEQQELRRNVNANVYQLIPEYLRENFRINIANRAKAANLLSLEEFSELPIELQNSREARNNQIIDAFLDIMKMPTAWEENLMSSNFEDIKDAKRKIFGSQDRFRNINTFEDQSRYRDEVMSGAQLKAISVKRDTFCSISNVSKTTLNASDGFKFIYHTNGKESIESLANRLRKAYGESNVEVRDNGVAVNHKYIGWSEDNNRNHTGKLITVYSSETTALILDGVKEGGVPNVNLYTFDVYKSIIDAGSDYETAILFINQPAITECINVNVSNENIFDVNNINEINTVRLQLYRALAEANGISLKQFESIRNIENRLKERKIEIPTGVDYLDVEELRSHMNDNIHGGKESEILYQIKVLNSFAHFKRIANQINNHSNLLNTDKVGAGQSVNETDKLIRDILQTKYNNENAGINSITLMSNITNDSLIDSIYPRVLFTDINDIRNDDSYSVYPSLYYQLKYGVIASSDITSNLFLTHSKEFKVLKQDFLDSRDLATIKEFENYIISRAMNQSTTVLTNSYKTKNSDNIFNNYNIDISEANEFENRRRIFGYNNTYVSEFDFNDFSEDNVAKFMSLTPANKVLLLQSKTTDDNLFKRLIVNIKDNRSSSKGRNSKQTINIIDSGIGYEKMYQLFKEAYYNNNPFIQTATIDLVRYSIVVEGYKFSGGSISKIIPTDILYGGREQYNSIDGVTSGLGIIYDTNRALDNLLNPNNDTYLENVEDIINNFYRSYTKSKDIIKFENKRRNGHNSIKFNLNGLAHLDEEEANKLGITKRINPRTEEKEYVKFVMTNMSTAKGKNKELTLFRVVPVHDSIYLYPVNRLEPNEIGDVSVNPDNRNIPNSVVYENIIKANENLNTESDISINNLSAIEKARYNITRDFTIVKNLNENLATSTPVKGSKKLIDVWLDAYEGQINVIRENQSVDNIDTSKRTILIVDDVNKTINDINELESKGYSNYMVIAQSSEANSIKGIINTLNQRDLNRIKEENIQRKLTINHANLQTKIEGKESGSYSRLKELTKQHSVRVINNGLNFISVENDLIRRLNFLPNTYHQMSIDGVNYVLTYLGEVNKKNLKILPDYINAESKDVLNEVVSKATLLSPYSRANIIKIETYEHFKNDVRESVIIDNDEAINKYISEAVASVERTERNIEDEAITEVARAFTNLDIRVSNTTKFNDIVRESALRVINGYTSKRSEYIFNKILNFYTDGDNTSYGITNPKLFDLMIADDNLRTEYENFLDSIHRFIEDYNSIESIELYDISLAERLGASEEELEGLRRSNETLKQIKDQFVKINALKNQIDNSRKMYYNKVISTLSTDPRIRTQLIELTEAFDDENWAQLKLADSQETHIPLVQVVLKEAMIRLRQSEIEARDKKVEFRNAIESILNEAKTHGAEVSLNDILDPETGNLLLPYTKDLVNKITELKQELKIAGIEDPEGRNGLRYKKAKEELEQFLIDNVERQYKSNYYQDYLNLNKILDKYPATYTKLKKLMQEQSEILSTMIGDDYRTLVPSRAKRLNEIRSEINEMRSTIDNDGNYKSNYYEANAVNSYYLRRRALDKKYKETEVKEEYEKRFKRAIEDLKYPETSDTYKEAKEWLDVNTYNRLSADFQNKLAEEYNKTRFGNPMTGYMITMFKGKYDSDGIIDGTKFNEKQVANIKKNEEQRFLAAIKRKKLKEDEAQAWLDQHVEWKNTKYYEAKYVEMNSQGKEVFDKWYKENHVVNQITGRYEPLLIWRTREIKDAGAYVYEPRPKWLETKVQDKWLNPKYKQGIIQTSSNTYRNDKYYKMNTYQQKLYNEVDGLLHDIVRDKRNRSFINKGYLPNQAIAEVETNGFKDWWKSFAASHGWYDTPMKSELETNFNRREVNAPMLHSLSKIKLIPLRNQMEGESNEDYAKYVRETNTQNRELEKQREEENKKLNNPNLGERLDAFIDVMYKYNTTNEVARLMKITSAQLRNMEFISRNSKGIPIRDKIMEKITGSETVRNKIAGDDSNVVKHFESQMRKLIFDEFEYDQGVASKISRVARNMVSLKFMTLNLTGGIANVLYGKTQIQMEEAAGDNFKYKDFRKAENEYGQALTAYFANLYKDTSNNETDAILKLFNVIESDMVTERYGKGDNPVGRFENLLYAQQSAGEHYMQNCVLLAMMNSHRVSEINGKPEVISFNTYTQELRENTLLSVLDNKQADKYKKTIVKINNSIVDKEQYVRFKRDAITDFLRTVDEDTRKKFIEKYKEAKKDAKTNFESLPTFRSQFELKDGYAKLRTDSKLTNRDIAEFREKTIKVNHHIHGIYDKIGANTIQQTWWGALAMQFHKHLVPGFQKRFGYRLVHTDGIYNETRETVNKGSYVSLAEFLAMPLKKHYELNDSNELVAVQGLQNIVKGYMDFISNFNTYYNILPEYDKANLRRVLGEWIAITKALAIFTVGKLMLDDDDEATQAADYILYSADRLMSESIQYTPWGMVNEGTKLYSQPVAAFSVIKDNYNLLSSIVAYVVTGDPEDLYYQSGSHAGENRVKTALVKQIPVWNQLQKHENLGANNSYYKLRSNPINGISSIIGSWIEDNE